MPVKILVKICLDINMMLVKENKQNEYWAGIFKTSMGARKRVIVPARQATYAGGIHSLESIPGPHTRLKIRALSTFFRRIAEAIPSLFPKIFSERNSIANPSSLGQTNTQSRQG